MPCISAKNYAADLNQLTQDLLRAKQELQETKRALEVYQAYEHAEHDYWLEWFRRMNQEYPQVECQPDTAPMAYNFAESQL